MLARYFYLLIVISFGWEVQVNEKWVKSVYNKNTSRTDILTSMK